MATLRVPSSVSSPSSASSSGSAPAPSFSRPKKARTFVSDSRRPVFSSGDAIAAAHSAVVSLASAAMTSSGDVLEHARATGAPPELHAVPVAAERAATRAHALTDPRAALARAAAWARATVDPRPALARAAHAAWTHPLVGAVAPTLVERHAVTAFATPIRPRRPSAPLVPGLTAHRFTVDSHGDPLAVWDWGTSGPTVLLVHGWNGAATQLARFVAPLVRAGYTVATFDQPGHGLSGGRRATLLTMRDAVRAVAATLGPIHAVIGHSLGAAASALAAADGLRLERLALLAPPSEVEYYVRGFAAQLGLPAARANGMLEAVRREVGGDLGSLDLRRNIVAAPTLVVHDPEDRDVPLAHGRAIARAWPNATLRTVAGVGHRRILSSPEVIADVVKFVSGR